MDGQLIKVTERWIADCHEEFDIFVRNSSPTKVLDLIKEREPETNDGSLKSVFLQIDIRTQLPSIMLFFLAFVLVWGDNARARQGSTGTCWCQRVGQQMEEDL